MYIDVSSKSFLFKKKIQFCRNIVYYRRCCRRCLFCIAIEIQIDCNTISLSIKRWRCDRLLCMYRKKNPDHAQCAAASATHQISHSISLTYWSINYKPNAYENQYTHKCDAYSSQYITYLITINLIYYNLINSFRFTHNKRLTTTNLCDRVALHSLRTKGWVWHHTKEEKNIAWHNTCASVQ